MGSGSLGRRDELCCSPYFPLRVFTQAVIGGIHFADLNWSGRLHRNAVGCRFVGLLALVIILEKIIFNRPLSCVFPRSPPVRADHLLFR